MAKILILGAGVMGSALTVPATDNGHEVTLATTPVDADVLAALSAGGDHPRLGAPLSPDLNVVAAETLTEADGAADLTIIGVSSPGIGWAVDEIARIKPQNTVALVTKGLVSQGKGIPLTYVDAIPKMLDEKRVTTTPLVGIGGPCIARELAERRPTAVVFAGSTGNDPSAMKHLLETHYYRISVSHDDVGVEACAALKNFYAIGVSAMITRHTRDGEPVKNPTAAAFQQAVDEMAHLADWLGGSEASAHGLAGVGDLHVTVGGGRNSRLGKHLGEGLTVAEAMDGPLKGETVEGVDVGRVLAPHLAEAFAERALSPGTFPLATSLIAAITEGGPLGYDVGVA
ncbi:MAG: glycerol-3-phosphate dehydrogenase [Pseudomonadota bacterium]